MVADFLGKRGVALTATCAMLTGGALYWLYRTRPVAAPA
jgi:hypothetical protein